METEEHKQAQRARHKQQMMRKAHQENVARIFQAFQHSTGDKGLAADLIDAIDEVYDRRGEAWPV